VVPKGRKGWRTEASVSWMLMCFFQALTKMLILIQQVRVGPELLLF
jgi:hypothetical protein